MKSFNILIVVTLLLIYAGFTSCSDKYRPYLSNYQKAENNSGPDYSNLYYWAAHPSKRDPSDSIPKPLRKEKRDTVVDVFFLHPTIYTGKLKNDNRNADINDAYLNAKTDYSSILYQASVFNQHARIFAPRFREAHISNYFIKDTAAVLKAFDLAYEDVKSAFEYYLNNNNKGRPIIIASHSQGTTHALRLLKDFFENKPLQEQLVAAYVVGMPISPNYFTTLKMCEDSLETGCLCGWRTFKKGYKPSYVLEEKEISLVTNPLIWKTTYEYATRDLNKGSVLYRFNKVYKKTTDAQIQQGVLWVRRPKFPWSFLYGTKNYHVGDINLYYKNIRENAEQRINNYFRKQSTK